MKRILALVLLLGGLALGCLTAGCAPVLAAPVDWHEVQPSASGRQWWDSGSLRINRDGLLTVLSRFQPATPEEPEAEDQRPRRLGDLYVMEIDCGQDLFRDISVNGLPRWGAAWQPVGPDSLIAAVVAQSCQAAGLRPAEPAGA